MSPLYKFYKVPMVRGDFLSQQGDDTLWWNHDQSVLGSGTMIWLGFVSCTPGWSGWNQSILCSRTSPQVEPPCVIFLCLVHRAAGKFIPGEAGGKQGVLESSCSSVLRNPTELTGSSGGCAERSSLCHHWEDDDGESGMTFGKMERPSQRGGSTSEGITRAVRCSSRVENNCVSYGECQQLVRKTQSKLSSWKAHLKLKYCFCFLFFDSSFYPWSSEVSWCFLLKLCCFMQDKQD